MKPTRIHLSRQPRLAAFTLVELLTVIAIVGILAGIIIPVISSVRSSAKTSNCAANLRQIAAGCMLYSAEHKNLLIPIAGGTKPNGADAQTWRLLISPYINQENAIGILGCPADDRLDSFDTSRGLLPASYGINKTIGLHQYLTSGVSHIASDVVRPTSTIMVSDISFVDNPGAPAGQWTDARRTTGSGNFGYARFPSDGFYSSDPWISFPRHGNKLNVAFYDGHVESISPALILDNTSGQVACIYDNN
ncbi:MAG: prepilin-type N-terminal cleavage/methylation domain-containing protein [Opitutaceae bacterium]|jgi:prepilin-type processing-associated H-X9-DG protein/prepilin-type N-terminal cleavage/methylation domain-containing protein